jgi:hypothetical protein
MACLLEWGEMVQLGVLACMLNAMASPKLACKGLQRLLLPPGQHSTGIQVTVHALQMCDLKSGVASGPSRCLFACYHKNE